MLHATEHWKRQRKASVCDLVHLHSKLYGWLQIWSYIRMCRQLSVKGDSTGYDKWRQSEEGVEGNRWIKHECVELVEWQTHTIKSNCLRKKLSVLLSLQTPQRLAWDRAWIYSVRHRLTVPLNDECSKKKKKTHVKYSFLTR